MNERFVKYCSAVNEALEGATTEEIIMILESIKFVIISGVPGVKHVLRDAVEKAQQEVRERNKEKN